MEVWPTEDHIQPCQMLSQDQGRQCQPGWDPPTLDEYREERGESVRW